MSNEVNLNKEEVMSETPVLSDSVNKDTSNGNKIVPIANTVVDTAACNPAAATAASVTTSDDSAASTADDVGNTAADNSIAANSVNAAHTTDNTVPVPEPEVSTSANKQGETAASGQQPAQSSSDKNYYNEEPDEEFHFADEERPRRPLFRFRSSDEEESRDKLILSRIKDEDLMEYLALEQRRLEFLQQAKETKQKRILTAFQLLISLAAIVAVTYLLKDNPTILISILYIVGIVAALNIWKNPHDKGRGRK